MIRHRMFARLVVWGTALVLLASAAFGQEPTPDRNGEVVTRTPELDGTRAQCPIPPEMHQQNNAGGRCVICSVVAAGRYVGLPREFTERLWAKSGVGGYSPTRLEGLIDEVNRELGTDIKWSSYYGPPKQEVVETLLRQGRPIGMTLTQADYARNMHHMVTDVHNDGQLACLVDNNRVGMYRWMPASRRLQLAVDGGAIWVFAWSQLPKPAVIVAAVSLVLITAALLLLAASTLMGGYGAYILTSESK